jgi:hypothetical protein
VKIRGIPADKPFQGTARPQITPFARRSGIEFSGIFAYDNDADEFVRHGCRE